MTNIDKEMLKSKLSSSERNIPFIIIFSWPMSRYFDKHAMVQSYLFDQCFLS
jgi:hypothetical protein